MAKATKSKATIDTIRCPYCATEFPPNGKPTLQTCPGCHSKLLL